VDREFRTLASREHRGCFGKSSGGYGAIIHGMKYAKYWGAIANHSGDACFDFVYWNDWPNTLNELAKHRAPKRKPGRLRCLARIAPRGIGRRPGRRPHPPISGKRLEERETLAGRGPRHHEPLHGRQLRPRPGAPNGFRVPFNLESGESIPERWRAWRRHDPVNLVSRYKTSLGTLRGIYIDCGWLDQYYIHYGTRLLSARLSAARIHHVYEEFDDNHSDIDYRMDVSLPFLYRALF